MKKLILIAMAVFACALQASNRKTEPTFLERLAGLFVSSQELSGLQVSKKTTHYAFTQRRKVPLSEVRMMVDRVAAQIAQRKINEQFQTKQQKEQRRKQVYAESRIDADDALGVFYCVNVLQIPLDWCLGRARALEKHRVIESLQAIKALRAQGCGDVD